MREPFYRRFYLPLQVALEAAAELHSEAFTPQARPHQSLGCGCVDVVEHAGVQLAPAALPALRNVVVLQLRRSCWLPLAPPVSQPAPS